MLSTFIFFHFELNKHKDELNLSVVCVRKTSIRNVNLAFFTAFFRRSVCCGGNYNADDNFPNTQQIFCLHKMNVYVSKRRSIFGTHKFFSPTCSERCFASVFDVVRLKIYRRFYSGQFTQSWNFVPNWSHWLESSFVRWD